MDTRCDQVLLARGVVAEVMHCCKCGVFHVNVGAITVHFEAPALRDLQEVLAEALAAHERMASADRTGVWQPPADVH